MNLTAIFESWHVGDGNYPPLNEGQLVNLSFELEPRKTEEVSLDVPESFEHLGKGEYRFCSTVLKVYETEDGDAITIIETGEFRFYITSRVRKHRLDDSSPERKLKQRHAPDRNQHGCCSQDRMLMELSPGG